MIITAIFNKYFKKNKINFLYFKIKIIIFFFKKNNVKLKFNRLKK
jgi:hypothetical protein